MFFAFETILRKYNLEMLIQTVNTLFMSWIFYLIYFAAEIWIAFSFFEKQDPFKANSSNALGLLCHALNKDFHSDLNPSNPRTNRSLSRIFVLNRGCEFDAVRSLIIGLRLKLKPSLNYLFKTRSFMNFMLDRYIL